jgi:hypothetical protein
VTSSLPVPASLPVTSICAAVNRDANPGGYGLGPGLADVMASHDDPLAPHHTGLHQGLQALGIQTVDYVRLTGGESVGVVGGLAPGAMLGKDPGEGLGEFGVDLLPTVRRSSMLIVAAVPAFLWSHVNDRDRVTDC